MAGQEKAFENRIKAFIRSKGGYCVKYFGCNYSTAGTPDILACINGYFLAIEVKSQSGMPSKLQEAKISEIRKAGGFAYIVYPSGWDEMKAIINGICAEDFSRENKFILK